MKSKLVGFMGAPGTGKTTLSCALKEYLLVKNISSDICTEYAREFCFKYGIPKHPYSQYRITTEQMLREDLLMRGNSEFVFSDSPVWLGYLFSVVNAKADQDREIHTILNDTYEKFVINQMHRYHKVFHLRNNKPYDDGCRDMAANKKIADIMDGFVLMHKHILPIITIDIPIEETEKRKEFVWSNLEVEK
jgi:nicotinamide riboside kinase